VILLALLMKFQHFLVFGMQMDRSWIRKGVRRLSTEHTKGVEEFMQFVHRSFGEDAQVLCPCRSCLNREEQTLANVEAHLLMYGMASTYDRWIHHVWDCKVVVQE
jgi:hypothetical protein